MNIVVFRHRFKYNTDMEENQEKGQTNEVADIAFRELTQTLAKAGDPDLIGQFLGCLLTPTEMQEVLTRWALVREIDAGTTQREIARKLGLSLCKITRGSRELKKENSPFKQMIDLYMKP